MRTTALIGVFAFAIAANAQVTTTLARRTISTTGTATVPATPDKARRPPKRPDPTHPGLSVGSYYTSPVPPIETIAG